MRRAGLLVLCSCLVQAGAVERSEARSLTVCVEVKVKTMTHGARARRPIRAGQPSRKEAKSGARKKEAPGADSGRQEGAANGGKPAQEGGAPLSERPAVVTPPSERRETPRREPTREKRRETPAPVIRFGYPYPPDAYLKRLVEHFVTHEKGFEAVQSGCKERITIELYPVTKGFTVFARYTKRGQEEKVDIIEYEEFPRFAERVVLSLLYGKSIEQTANLRTILKADSLRHYKTIKGSHYFTFMLGSSVRVGPLPTVRSSGAAEEKVRVLTPMVFSMGYRGRFNAWGIDAYVRGGVGLNRKSVLGNPQGGHVDLDGMFGLGIHFLRYHNPHDMISFYYGGGAIFDLTVFSSIRAEENRSHNDRDRITGGGLNLNGVLGFEFMRASAAQFYLQLVLSLPVYIFESQSRSGELDTWLPETSVQIGIMF